MSTNNLSLSLSIYIMVIDRLSIISVLFFFLSFSLIYIWYSILINVNSNYLRLNTVCIITTSNTFERQMKIDSSEIGMWGFLDGKRE